MYVSSLTLLTTLHSLQLFANSWVGSFNAVYLARLLRSLDPYPAEFDKINKVSAGHQIYANVIRNSKNIFLLTRNFDRLLKRGINLFFTYYRGEYKVFSPLRSENVYL